MAPTMDSSYKTPSARRVLTLYGLSGLFSLGYQVVWLRHFVDRFGSSTFTFVLVVSGFIGGLGLGAFASRSAATRLRALLGVADDLRLYGVLELLIGASALLVFAERLVPMELASRFPYALDASGIWSPTMAYHMLRVPLALLSVLVPCFLMGMTYPLLCQAFHDNARFPARLYAWNTLGACTGVLACELALLRVFGTTTTLLLMVGGNLALGAYFALRGMRTESQGIDRHLRTQAPVAQGPTSGTLLLAASVSGFLSGAIESDVFHWMQFHQIFNDSSMAFVSFWAILAIFAASACVDRGQWSFGRIKLAYVVGFVTYVGTVFFLLERLAWWIHNDVAGAFSSSPERFVSVGGDPSWRTEGSPLVSLVSFFVIGVATFPSYACVSLLLPYLCNINQARGNHLGRIYGLNTLAFLVGLVTFTWLAPWVSIFYALKLCSVVFAILVLLTMTISATRPLRRGLPVSALGAVLAATLLVPHGFDYGLFPLGTLVGSSPARAVKGSPGYTTFVSEQPQGDVLYLGTGKMSDTTLVAKRYMRLLAHVPLLCHPDPRRVLLVCFGIGNTASAIAKHDSVRAIDIVDLSRNVLMTAPEFAQDNDRVWEDPRVRLVCDDGRAFLSVTNGTYDMITSEPPPPLMHGVSRLYSSEYYASVLAHLTPNGLMSQWLPVAQMPPGASALIASTFVQSFPHALLFTGAGRELILVGSRSPIDLALLAQRMEELPAVRAQLAEVGLPSARELLASVLWTDADLRRWFGHGEVISDQCNALSLLWPTGRTLSFPYDPEAVLACLPDALARDYDLRALLTDFHGLVSHVPWFPSDSLVHTRDPSLVRGADVPWNEVERLQERAEKELRSGDALASWNTLDEIDRLSPNLSLTALRRGMVLLAGARPGEARTWFERAAALLPGYPLPLQMAGLTSLQARDATAARRYLEEALERNPRSVEAHVLLARTLAVLGDHDGARGQLEAALDLRPGDAEVLELLERLQGGGS